MKKIEEIVNCIWDEKDKEIEELVEDFLGFFGEASVLNYPDELIVKGMSTFIKYKNYKHSQEVIFAALDRINKRYAKLETSEQRLNEILSSPPASNDFLQRFKELEKQPENIKKIRKTILITYTYINELNDDKIIQILTGKIKELKENYPKLDIIKAVDSIFKLNFNEKIITHVGIALEKGLKD